MEVGQEFLDHFVRRWNEEQVCGEVVMVVPRTSGEVLVMTKAFYPEDVYRLPTGGMCCGEEPEGALNRELLEETGFILPIDRFLGKLDYILRGGDGELCFSSYIYVMQPTQKDPRCSDSDEHICGFRYVPVSELQALAESLRNLAGRWQDWGRFRAIAHDYIAVTLLPYD